jgi:teichuronic acid biosynthesis glycosyltransferase TuaC
MKVLFVSSGNTSGFEIVPFIKEQGESLRKAGVDVAYFPIRGKGLSGYLKAGLKLRKFLKSNHYDLIHAHFTLSGYAAVLGSRGTPVVLSLMGSDAYGEYVGENKVIFFSRFLTLLTLLIQPFVRAIISKSDNIEQYVYLKRKSFIVPNGIDTEKFRPSATDFRSVLSLNPQQKQVLFLGSKKSVRKNIKLVQQAMSYLNRNDVELINPYPIAHEAIPKYLNSVNVLAICSYMEGSPNVVKEAMACNCPMVATNVGDIKWVFGTMEGCYIASFQPEDFAKKLQAALTFSEAHQRTKGEQRIKELGLDSKSIAQRVVEIYKIALKQK